jgi:hypothetical protein
VKRLDNSAIAFLLLTALTTVGCEEQIISPTSAPEAGAALAGKPRPASPFVIQFQGDIAATAQGYADPNNLWGTLKIDPANVTLPGTLIGGPRFIDVHWPPTGGPDPNSQYLWVDYPYCTYSEASPFAYRPNSWGLNAQGGDGDGVWQGMQVLVSLNRDNAARIDVRSPSTKGRKGSTGPTLNIVANDADARVEGNTLYFEKGQSLVSAGSPEGHTDPCITVTITATPGQL